MKNFICLTFLVGIGAASYMELISLGHFSISIILLHIFSEIYDINEKIK